jgi:hypothetical protein
MAESNIKAQRANRTNTFDFCSLAFVLFLLFGAFTVAAAKPRDGVRDGTPVFVPNPPGSAVDSCPWTNASDTSVRYQELFLGSELGRTGALGGFAWQNASAGQFLFDSVTILLCTTSVATLNPADFDGNYGGMTPVVVFGPEDRAVGSGTVGDWDSIVIPNFTYTDTAMNLLLEVTWNGGGGAGYASFAGTGSGNRRVWAWDHLADSGQADSVLNNGRFTFLDPPTGVSVTRPSGGEVWQDGVTHNVTWTSSGDTKDSLLRSTDSGATWSFIADVDPDSGRSFAWSVSGDSSAACRVMVVALNADSATAAQDTGLFSIVPRPRVQVLTPCGCDNWEIATIQNITWNSSGSVTDSVLYSTGGGDTWHFITKQSPPGSRRYPWPIPNHPTIDCVVKICAVSPDDSAPVTSTQSLPFSIVLVVGAWTRKVDVPIGLRNKSVKDGGALAYGKENTHHNDTGYVYALKGNSTHEFYRYNTTSNVWIAEDSIPAVGHSGRKKTVKKGAALVMGTDSRVYATKGSNTYEFWQYDPGQPQTQRWTQLPDVPTGARGLKDGTGLAAVDIAGTDYIHLLKGSGTYEFYSYNIESGTWATMAPAPGGASRRPYKCGSSIVYDNNDTIWCLKGSYNELAAYSVSGNNWVSKDPVPLQWSPGAKKTKVKDGSQITYGSRVLYALKGDNTDEFWTYVCDERAWDTAARLPPGTKNVKGGGALVADKSGHFLFALRGNNTLEFWRYYPVVLEQFGREPGPEAQGSSAYPLPPTAYRLSVAPNPLTSRTTIRYTLPVAGNVALRLYDVTGRIVATLARGYHAAGDYALQLAAHGSGQELAPGVYVLKLKSAGGTATGRLIIE